MLVLRGTQRVLRLLPQSADNKDVSHGALGDWYINRIVVHRQPLLLCVSSKSLLSLLIPARDVKSLPNRFPESVAERLARLGVDASLINSELEGMKVVRVGRTLDRSVTMVDFAKALSYYLPLNDWGPPDLRLAEERLADTPCRCSSKDTIWPKRDTILLLAARWITS